MENYFSRDIKILINADDITVYFASKCLLEIENKLQNALTSLELWANETGFLFSSLKTTCVHFAWLRKYIAKPDLYLNHQTLLYSDYFNYLGLKLLWLNHLNFVKKRCTQKLNILKTLSNTKCGSEPTVMLNVHQSIVLSTLDYGSIANSSAKQIIRNVKSNA